MADLPAPAQADGAQAQPGAPKIDVQKLADRVYQLMLADARLGRARGDSPQVPTRMGEA
jgi:hypothetical protein